jgi:hypothetical protein
MDDTGAVAGSLAAALVCRMEVMPSEYPHSNPLSDYVKPARNPLGECGHHTDELLSDSDIALGDKLAWYMGDLFMNSKTDAPTKQWSSIARALRIHGLMIVNR